MRRYKFISILLIFVLFLGLFPYNTYATGVEDLAVETDNKVDILQSPTKVTDDNSSTNIYINIKGDSTVYYWTSSKKNKIKNCNEDKEIDLSKSGISLPPTGIRESDCLYVAETMKVPGENVSVVSCWYKYSQPDVAVAKYYTASGKAKSDKDKTLAEAPSVDWTKYVANGYANKKKSNSSSGGSDNSGGSEDSTEASTGGSDEDLKSELGVDNTKLNRLKAYYLVLKDDGFSDAAIAGILGNCMQESGINPLASEKNKKGEEANGGLFGFTPMTNFSNSTYNQNCTHKKGSAGGQNVCADGSCQVAYMLGVLSDKIDANHDRIDKYNERVGEGGVVSEHLKTHGWDKSDKKNDTVTVLTKIETCNSLDDFKKFTDPMGAAGAFSICYEVCAGTYVPCGIKDGSYDMTNEANWHNNWSNGYTAWDYFINEFKTYEKGRLKYADIIYTWITGASFDASDATDEAGEVAVSLAKNGYWSEEQLSTFCKMHEIKLDMATIDSLSVNQKNTLTNWKDTVTSNIEDTVFVTLVRRLATFIGIFFMIWVSFLYMAFWFDRVNVFFEFSFLSLLSFGRLELSPEEDKCTYKLSEMLGKKGKVTVNHRAMLEILILGCIIGGLVVSGLAFDIIRRAVLFILNFLGIVD